MRYAGIIENDVVNGEGVCLSVFTQGCPHRCKGCFNPETWDFNGGIEIKDIDKFLQNIISKIKANEIKRNLSILGGEPLCEENRVFTAMLIFIIKLYFPDIKIFLWTGYTIEELKNMDNSLIDTILVSIDYLIDGPFIEEERDITLKWRGSKNQRILTKEKIYDIINRKENKYD